MAMTLLVFTACALTVAHADGARAETAAHAPKEAEGGADGVASNADEDAEMEALFRAKREKKRLAQEEKRRAQDAARAHAAQEADEALRAQHEQARAEAAEADSTNWSSSGKPSSVRSEPCATKKRVKRR